ncbi:hypothetical protein [Nocardioides sp. W7]|uniref:hypothetical protein n=1 Tax=Nocardioides sp. W7 TaxID=2931390 RepID=UPI001FD48E53|nr:hypothetical protein [Nocardioides sp. W7]
MAPRPGGETDKIGNRYELAWTIRHALYCILDASRSLTPEESDVELGKGSEFTYVAGSRVEIHQLKRQDGNSNQWNIKTLNRLNIFAAAAEHVAAGHDYHFVSLVPCGPLRELSERARKSSDLQAFTRNWLTNELSDAFDELAATEVLGSPAAAWSTLRGMWFEVHDEHDIVRVNGMLAELSLEGTTGHLASLALGDIVLGNLGKRLVRANFLEELQEHGIKPLAASSRASTAEQVRAVTTSWRSTVQRELLQPAIGRSEATELASALQVNRVGLVVGTAGGGKSAALEQLAESAVDSGAEILAFRLDRLDRFASTVDLGRQLGLDGSPAAALAMAADGRDAYLVIDQLDAVSLASGRMPESFDVVVDLIGEALSVSGMRVVLACREFDVDNDHRIRALAARPDLQTVPVALLSTEAVEHAVTEMQLDPTSLSASQRELLRTPLHLVLLSSIAGQADALAFESKGSLFEAFWQRKRQAVKARRDTVRYAEVLARIANAVSDRQVLSVPIEVLDEDDLIDDANVLVSEHVLAQQDDRIAFFHEAFFDYTFARQWVSRSENLVDFLQRDEQELFRRSQIRQILQHLHERDADRFLSELEALLISPAVRYHIKETALAVLANLQSPTSDDAAVALKVAASKPSFESRIWQQLRRPQWFARLYDDGPIAEWLDSDDQVWKDRAANIMLSGTVQHGGAVVELLQARQHLPDYLLWVRSVVSTADLHKFRPLFDVFLDAVRSGAYRDADQELWLSAHELAEHEPAWAIELLQARFIDPADALAVDDDGKVINLALRDYSLSELVRTAAAAEPRQFLDVVVPYLREVMAVAAYDPRDDDGVVRDRHFSMRYPDEDHDERELEDVLFAAAMRALEDVGRSTPAELRPVLETLSADPYEASQFLLYRALIAACPEFADWSASLLLQGGTRLRCGYMSDSTWVARELVAAIAPHLTDAVHLQLELAVRDLKDRYESRRSGGRAAFTFLSALDESRLSADGTRRLGEYRRKFGANEPPAPTGIRGGFIGSPIAPDASAKMSDDQWLRAMAKYGTDETNWDSFTGGARELSRALQEQVKTDPSRFTKLALRFTADFNPSYGDAILMGFGDAVVGTDEDAEHVYTAVRHISSLGHEDNERWLGTAIRRFNRQAPLDLVELILDRALHAADPVDDSPVFVRQGDDGKSAKDLHGNGINTTRGTMAEALGDLLVFDVDGTRTELVRPHLETLASDPVLYVRSCVAHTIAASLRHARPDAVRAFERLIEAEDVLLASGLVQQLMLYIGNVNPDAIDPVIARMLASDNHEAREAGGALAAFASLEWSRPELMAQALAADEWVRRGAADVAAGRVDRTSNSQLATAALLELMNDNNEDVRKEAAGVAAHLRDLPLRPYAQLLIALIESPAYDQATPQLLITLQHAPDKVDDLVLRAARRFLEIFGDEAADIRHGAAGDARYISELVVRGLAQSRDRSHRAALLDVLDRLLELGVYGIGDAISKAERS